MNIGDQFYYQWMGYIAVAEIMAVRNKLVEANLSGSVVILFKDFETTDPAFRGWVKTTAIPTWSPPAGSVAAAKTYYHNGTWVTPEDFEVCPDCKTKTEHKKFNTFEYDYCPKCKKEVDLKSQSNWKGKDYYD